MTRVSTANLQNQTIGAALQVQSQLADVQIQESSGLVAQDFGTLGGASTTQVLNLENEISQSQGWADNAATVSGNTQAMYTATGTMSTLVSQLQSRISNALSSSDNSGLLQAAQSLQQSLMGQMNTHVAGNYLFAGTNSSVPPVSLANYGTLNATAPNAYAAGTPDTSYYTGNNTVLAVQVSLQQNLNYGVTANNPAFEEAMRATQAVIQAATTSTSSTATATSPTAASTVTGGPLVINGRTVTVNAADSLSTIAANINAAAISGVTATVLPDTNVPPLYHVQLSAGSGTLTIADTSGLGVASASPLPRTQLNAALQLALGVANQAVTDLSNLQGSISDTSTQLSNAQQQQSTFVTYLENSLSSVKEVNTGTVAAEVSNYQTQLQASYLAVASVRKISLAQYL
jgi:flagellar hook-associated protein 3 FlgL